MLYSGTDPESYITEYEMLKQHRPMKHQPLNPTTCTLTPNP